MKREFHLAALFVLAVLSAGAFAAADTILTNGNVVTVDDSFSIAQAVAIKTAAS